MYDWVELWEKLETLKQEVHSLESSMETDEAYVAWKDAVASLEELMHFFDLMEQGCSEP